MAEDKVIKVVCSTADYLDLDEIVPFQGRFKLRTQKDIEVLAGYILEQGFSCPFFIWKRGEDNLILDGHGRYLALEHLKSKGYEIPKLPVVMVEAADEAQARLKVLELNNVNGTFSKEVLLDYARELTIDYSNLHIQGLDFSDVANKFKPSLDPVIGNSDVTDAEVESVSERMSQITPAQDSNKYRDVSCLHCNASFSVRVW